MDASTITTLVSTLGFPIVTSVALFWYVVNNNKQTNETLEKLRTTIEENTKLISSILIFVKKDEGEK